MSKTQVKDVQDELLKKRKCRRRPGDVIYPLEYTNEMVNFDNWDHLFFTKCCRSLTMHQFDTPPLSVLDLGCGRGLWAIEAAKQWKESFIVGFDIKPKQPKLSILDPCIARRLEWVVGNFLDPLPFTAGQFDLVRMVRLGLHIPEDEWPYVLEEVTRVLKPGGVLEMVEEDLIFPCQRIDSTITFSSSGPSSIKSSARSSKTDVTVVSESYQKPESSNNVLNSKSGSADTFPSSSASPSTASLAETIPEEQGPVQPAPDLRDHSRLKQAWEDMLDSRFLASQLLAVLPFYLNSSFTEIRSRPPLQFPLPSNSPLTKDARPPWRGQDLLDPDSLFVRVSSHGRPSGGTNSNDDDNVSIHTKKSSQRAIPSSVSMHLARTVRTIIGCKDSIWEAYERLFGNDPNMPRIMRTSRLRDIKNRIDFISGEDLEPSINSTRAYFERDWQNWENDMTDRIGIRGSITSELLWAEPLGKPPDMRVWRKSLPPHAGSPILEVETKPADLCRSLRGFVCWKPFNNDSVDTLVGGGSVVTIPDLDACKIKGK
ncbi:hypothetical protein SERLA73DRAFT_181609 [Serpula lacrymans var. lacrymans S7.3]|uniref:Methyltransferase domain-containing protein n=2 Tax=Serpula lacrymans var. lacrymans TaxID=341189 RepID=F8PYD2_SERL3|nr:uncharacterized protein SERLADRAFT_467887 [Serpula lacrymans var. lacrymans S7.9]EGN98895.1 hypothetical protein SERLA73DRAFT_181609 [Serpula lacrymans var. lacrymans S7.3]EGO24489.1 hypothetical protein SERLADRAFT_467887 [Serpula lacrymans var. lacrymans S7.9]